jgi:hypothetical protein
MTDETRPIRQISRNLQEFQAATGELRYVTVKVAICGAFVEGTPKHLARRAHDGAAFRPGAYA